jgi:hypothetical protein
MSRLTHSDYARWGFYVSLGITLLVWLVCSIVVICLCLCQPPTRRAAIIVGVFFTISIIGLNLMLAATSSLREMHTAGTIILAAFINFVVGPFIAVAFSKRFPVLFRRPPVLQEKVKVEADGVVGEGVPGVEHGMAVADAPAQEEVHGMSDPAAVTTLQAQPLPAPSCMRGCMRPDANTPLRLQQRGRVSYLRDAIIATLFPQLLIVYLCLAITVALTHVLLADGCLCIAPTEYTTWASRSASDGFCKKKRPCHTYGIVGSHCSMIGVIGHYVAGGSSDAPTFAIIDWRLASDPTGTVGGRVSAGDVPSSFADGLKSTAVVSSSRGRIVVDHPIHEDHRVVVQAPLRGLACATAYAVSVRYYRADRGGAISFLGEGTTTISTLPDADAEVKFVGGGDMSGDENGHNMMRIAWASQPDSHFVWVGGDVSYANNMRTCYRRWDTSIQFMLEGRRPDGSSPLLMTAVGNHEAGGYLLASNKEERRVSYTHYTTYFPSSDFLFDFELFPGPPTLSIPSPPLPATSASPSFQRFANSTPTFSSTVDWFDDETITFQRSYIGSAAWLTLDSGIMLTVEEQQSLINETLTYWQQLLVQGSIKKIIVAYHNPSLPSAAPLTDTHSAAVRKHFVIPFVLKFNVSLVFEHHDHAYKRTVVLSDLAEDGNSGTVAAPGTFGTLFVGDGSLGIGSRGRPVKARWYHEWIQEGNYAMKVILLPNGTVFGTIFDDHSNILDEFVQ